MKLLPYAENLAYYATIMHDAFHAYIMHNQYNPNVHTL